MSGPDHSAFRHALAQFPTGVTVVTGRSPSRELPVGLTVSSFNSVSLSPPLVLWSLSNHSPHLEAFQLGQKHRIHVLSRSQEELAKRFARAGSDKFSGISTQLDSARHDQAHAFESVPHLAGCSARFDCMTESTHLAGDHCIIVARVLFFEATELEPLVFAQSGFFGLSKH